MYKSLSMPEFDELVRKNDKLEILDVREKTEFESGHISNAKSLPLSEFPISLDKETTYYVICHSGGRSSRACEQLSTEGYDVVNVLGGMSAWRGEVK